MIVPTEKIYKKFDNKYMAVNVTSLEARKLKDEQVKGLLEGHVNPIFEAIRRLIAGKIRYQE
jgi:DNA-directed RNA polymerase subunit K/omega